MAEQLPSTDYDQLPLGDLRHRVRSLTEEGLERVRDHEREHGNRAPVLQVITARLEELAGGAEPAPGDRRNASPVSGAAGGSPVPPAHSPDGNTPLRHGVYHRPRRAGGPGEHPAGRLSPPVFPPVFPPGRPGYPPKSPTVRVR
ncbi:hypothetical protein [Lentzea jiangxiensis]|uniref:hypothetical protein n=1 Tax=Lentzea jiangxiensis TaxID=641025 RepID=UPI000ABF6C37|nr:hypothetical protein [Lentzea jiangxiensis]